MANGWRVEQDMRCEQQAIRGQIRTVGGDTFLEFFQTGMSTCGIHILSRQCRAEAAREGCPISAGIQLLTINSRDEGARNLRSDP